MSTNSLKERRREAPVAQPAVPKTRSLLTVGWVALVILLLAFALVIQGVILSSGARTRARSSLDSAAIWLAYPVLLDDALAATEVVDALTKSEMLANVSVEHEDGKLFVQGNENRLASTWPIWAVRGLTVSVPITHNSEVIGRLSAVELPQAALIAWLMSIPMLLLVVLAAGGVYRIRTAGMRDTLLYHRQALEDLSAHDPVTGLLNRDRLIARLQALIAERETIPTWSLLYIDVERLRDINAAFGRNGGDSVLRSLSKRLDRALGPDDIAARLGDDEFAVVIPRAMESTILRALAHSVQANLAQPIDLRGGRVTPSIVVGAVRFPFDAADLDSVMLHGEQAMRAAKRDSRQGVLMFEELRSRPVRERINLDAELRNAMKTDAVYMVYQPQVDPVSGRIVGAEALVRWRHPVLGEVPPIRFIRVAEESSLIVDFGLSIFERVCDDLRKMGMGGVLLPIVAVNVSAEQLRRSDLHLDLRALIRRKHVTPSALEIEITEGALMEPGDGSISTVEELHDGGFRVAIDDFGTGYSSLAYLQRLPVSKLKLDRAFIQGIPDAAGEAHIVSAVIGLGHALKLSVVAEGVENGAQADYLREAHCDAIQGFHYYPPISPADLRGLLIEQSRIVPVQAPWPI